MPRFLINHPEHHSCVFELFGDRPISVGRAKSSGLLLDDPSVSRSHAVLRPTFDGHWQIIDRESANGVQINGVKVKEAVLRPNDEIGLGEFKLRYEEAEIGGVVTQATVQLPPRLTKVLNEIVAEPFYARNSLPEGLLPGTPERRVDLPGRIRALEQENRLLTLLYRVNRVLSELDTVEDVTQRVLGLALEIEGAERGYVMLLDEASQGRGDFHKDNYSLQPAIIRYRDEPMAVGGSKTPHLILSQSIIRRVLEGGLPLLISDVQSDPRFYVSKSIALSGLRSAMCAPLGAKDRCFGLLYVDNLSRSGMFSQEALNIFAVIAVQAGLGVERVRARNEVVQQRLKLTALQRFLSPEIARKIVTDAADLHLGGENQKVTLLFSDIRGFTAMAESMPPEEVVEVLNRFFQRMSELVFAHEGTIDKYIGDGLMCLFGAPFPRENSALAAVLTAIEMQKNLAELNRAEERPPLRIGVGINTGQVTVGYLGAPHRMDYTAIGDAVNVASRLTALAGPEQILISSATCKEFGNRVPTRRLDPMKLKGRGELVETYEVLWQEFPSHNARPATSTPVSVYKA